jgi:hypothetical protein
MDKKLITEDIQRMRFMFGYEPGKVISEQQDINEIEGIFSELDPNELEGVLDAVLKTEKSDYTHLEKSKEDDDDFEEDDDDEVIYEIEVEEGFDSPEMKQARGGKDFSTKEFKNISKGSKFNIDKDDRDDSITTKKYIDNQIDDFLDDDVDLSWLDESWDEE